MSSKSRQQLVDFLGGFDISNKIVLDVGCGDSKYWARNFTKGSPAVYHTIDVEPSFNPTYKLDLNKRLDSESEWVSQPKREYYDVIFCIETLEHLYNGYQAVSNMVSWLKPDGLFVFSTPFINPIHDIHGDMARYTSEWYEEVLPKFGLTNVSIEPRIATDGLDLLLAFYRSEGLRMSKVRVENGEGHKISHIGYMGYATR